jgi:subtilisin family serine protease
MACAVTAASALSGVATAVASGPTSTPDDPGFRDHSQWGLSQAGFPAGWCRSTGAGTLIVVIDTGIDATHPDLSPKLVGQASVHDGAVVTGAGAAADDSGHGTHVAGVAAAQTGNGTGIAGAAPDARLYAIKVLFANPGGGVDTGSRDDLVQAIDYASETVAPSWPGPVVINISIGAADPSSSVGGVDGGAPDAIDAAISRASSRGLGVALAAGNAGTSAIGTGAAAAGAALAVGALDQNGNVAPYSPTAGVGVFAAGGSASSQNRYTSTGILSTWPHSASGDYAWMAGTSMAAPHVAAALALLMATGLTNQQAYARVLDTADARHRLHVDAALDSTQPCGAVAPPATRAAPVGAVRGARAAPPTAGANARPAATTPAPAPVAAAPRSTPASARRDTAAAAALAAPPGPASTGHPWLTRAGLGLGVVTLAWLLMPRRLLRRPARG